jgi:hypothetical protein
MKGLGVLGHKVKRFSVEIYQLRIILLSLQVKRLPADNDWGDMCST